MAGFLGGARGRGAILALALVGLAFLPALRAARLLAGLRGPLAAFVLALAAGTLAAPALGRALAPVWGRLARASDWALLALGIVVLVPVGLRYASTLQATGDEPHYLIMAQSLWRDGDLDLANNYEAGDWREYTPGPLLPHYGAPRRDGRPFPAHSPGLPVLLAPFYALGGRAACVVVLSVLAAGLAVEVRRSGLRLTGHPEAALLAYAAALGPPAFFYSFHVYTEVPSALALAACLDLLTRGPGLGGAIAAALLASVLPWLHVKMIPAAIALGVLGLVRLRSGPRAAFGLVAGAMAAAFALYYQSVFGQPSPLALYAGLPADARSSPAPAFFGLLLDRSFGLLPWAPVYLLALAGLPSLVRLRAWPHLLLGLAVLAPVFTWRMWWGGQCPPARLLVPIVPLLGASLAARAAEGPRGLLRWRGALLAIGFGLALIAVASPGRLLLVNRGSRPTRLWAALSGDGDLGRYLPSMTQPEASDFRVAALWALAIALLLVLDARARDNERGDRAFGGLELPLLLLLALGLGVDLWARPGPAPPPSVADAAGPGS
jgi:hypothetical protein